MPSPAAAPKWRTRSASVLAASTLLPIGVFNSCATPVTIAPSDASRSERWISSRALRNSSSVACNSALLRASARWVRASLMCRLVRASTSSA